VPVGGGGLLSGVAAAVKAAAAGVRWWVSSRRVAHRWAPRAPPVTPVRLPSTASIADGLLTLRPGDLTFAHAQALVDEMVTVTDDEIRARREVAAPRGGAGGGAERRRRDAAVLASGRRDGVVAIVSGGTSKPRTSRSTRPSAATLCSTSAMLASFLPLLLIPLSLALEWMSRRPLWVFLSGAAAIIPLSNWIRRATEQVAERAGPRSAVC
jgi:threonine dehydratase